MTTYDRFIRVVTVFLLAMGLAVSHSALAEPAHMPDNSVMCIAAGHCI